MSKLETLEDFYKRKFNWIPQSLQQEIGHFNLFQLKPIEKGKKVTLPYQRRDFYKVMLCLGGVEFHYADKVVGIERQALVFSNPQIPYTCEYLERIQGGFYCIFDRHFFQGFGSISKYEVFQPNHNHIFELEDEQAKQVGDIYQKMFKEFDSDYTYKYDVLRTLVFEILHFAMKLQPSDTRQKQQSNATQRIATLFFELLERQFPIEENHPKIQLRSASDFAEQLNVHVNHLNRAIKQVTQKTTSQVIAERILQESKILLKHSSWNVSEIAYALGFTEPTHFNNFFKKHIELSPTTFRKL